jgi:hypothetical protein
MKRAIAILVWLGVLVLGSVHGQIRSAAPGSAQVPTWSRGDLDFFLHGSMSTEVIPEAVLRAFIKT